MQVIIYYQTKKISFINLFFHSLGVDQACLLTKTIPFYELPQSIKQTLGNVTLPDQDDLIQSYIRQSIAYDATKEHLPRKKTPPNDSHR